MDTSPPHVYLCRLDCYLGMYSDDGTELAARHTPLGVLPAAASSVRDISAGVWSGPIALDVDSFVQQKIVELNSRRHRQRQLSTVLDFDMDVERSVLDASARREALCLPSTRCGLSLDALLFDEPLAAGDSSDQDYGADGRSTVRTSGAARGAHERYRQLRVAAETLEAERGQALQSLLTHRQRQNDLALSMDDSIRRNSSILLGLSQEDTDPNQSRIEVPVGGSSSLEEIKVKLGSLGREDEMSDSFDSWLASFKSSRPAAGLHSPPATPSTPPRFDDSPSRSPARQSASLDRIELSHGHTQLSSVLNVATSPARSAAPMRHQGSPGMDGDPPSTSRPPPHPRGRQVGKGVLSRNRFLNV